jgi:hypothetical protein
MVVRIQVCLAAALLVATMASAGAASSQDADGENAAAGAASGSGQAVTADPYNQSDFSTEQSFGLVASQMLGAAASCEHLHSDSVSLSGMQAAKSGKGTGGDRSAIDTAQQNFLDPAATSPGTLKGSVDCDRVGGSFSKLQQIQLHNQYLTRDLDQPGAPITTTK